MKQAPRPWPNGARIAVLLTVMYESWPEGKGPPYGPMASSLKEGTLDLQSVSWADYGGKTGVWRLLRMFDSFGVKATFCANAKSLERFPEAARELGRAGHEIAGHSYTQNMFLPYMSEQEEREIIDRCAGIIEATTGTKMVGWASPRMTPTVHTAGILAERGMLWHGDYHDTDMPEILTIKGKRIVALPHSEFTDNRVMRGSPKDFLDVYLSTFDYLYENEPGAQLNLTLHTHFGARPPIAAMLHQILKHYKSHEGVWFAKHDEIAQHVLGK
jgi:peptidoglycan/xylan/chitin deacetylase (PgdA/CDA1 family)